MFIADFHVSGWKPQIDNTRWTVSKVTHHLTERGYTSTLELEIRPADLEEEAASDASLRP
ncbi:hypothetical protein BJN34_14365 [Cupriavidus necator]|uniref:Uncharacterized protein n=1 Tax=Cupriavidus necator TaxID=106590 RepID=A0A1U9UQU8_CUPNE|nr:hypothetical protein [Cupriavidus necator]AQV95062.1 hypothetical protein BJN34_14365 [Cupriavidus necator]